MILSLVLSLALAVAAAPLAAGTEPDFRLQDHIGREWKNERVTFPLTAGQLAHAKAGHALLGPGDKPVTYQLMPGGPGETRIVFLADLAAHQTNEYRFADAAAARAGSDIKVEETADVITLTNSKTGIRLARMTKDWRKWRGPLAGVRLASGAWVGESKLLPEAGLAVETAVEISGRGPVFAEARCRLRLANGTTWRAIIRLDANEPAVLIDEEIASNPASGTLGAEAGGGAIRLDLGRGFDPDRLLFRRGKGDLHRNDVAPIEAGEVYVLEPWLHWWLRDRQGNCCSFFRQDSGDLLTLGAREAGVWAEPTSTLKHAPQGDEPPAPPRPPHSPALLTVMRDGKHLYVDLPLLTGRRKWMLAATEKAPALAEMKEPNGHHRSLEPYRLLIKHGHFPLDMVKDYVLAWDDSATRYPHMLVTPADVERLRSQAKQTDALAKPSRGYLRDPNPMNQFTMETPIRDWIVSGDAEAGRYLARSVLHMMQDSLDVLVRQDTLPLGAAPHHLSGLHAAMLAADAALAAGQFSPAERARLLAQAAFIGYTLARPEFWSPARGYAANPNMTTTVHCMQATTACLISSHPMGRAWAAAAMDELKGMLDDWSDDNGGWLEAPHYAMYAYDMILGALVMARNGGINDYLDDPKVKTVINWFSKISTPPDSRLGGFRHLPPVGNTYLQEASGEFAILAFLFRQKDPAFSAQQQWMFRQQRSWPSPGVGGAYPAFAGYRGLLSDPSLPAKAPPWTSELFPKTGLVLRNAYPSDRETYLYMIQGANHAHYDDDSGNVILWGKGRIVADNFGYYNPAAEDHNMVQAPQAGGVMRVTEFIAGADVDFVRGQKGGWTRQIAFVKSADVLGPNYFVFCDSLRDQGPATWRLHVIAEKVTPAPGRASVEGNQDVDTEVVFVQPAALEPKTEPKTRKANSGIFPDGRTGAVPMTQIAISAAYPAGQRTLTAVVYPRPKTQPAPRIVPVADGKGVKIEYAGGAGPPGVEKGDVDYVFLGPQRFSFQEGDVAFDGTAGVIQVRAGKPALWLGAPGSIRYKTAARSR